MKTDLGHEFTSRTLYCHGHVSKNTSVTYWLSCGIKIRCWMLKCMDFGMNLQHHYTHSQRPVSSLQQFDTVIRTQNWQRCGALTENSHEMNKSASEHKDSGETAMTVKRLDYSPAKFHACLTFQNHKHNQILWGTRVILKNYTIKFKHLQQYRTPWRILVNCTKFTNTARATRSSVIKRYTSIKCFPKWIMHIQLVIRLRPPCNLSLVSFCSSGRRGEQNIGHSHRYSASELLVYMQMYASQRRRRICSGRSRSSCRRRISSYDSFSSHVGSCGQRSTLGML